MARIIVHEATHRFAATGDFGCTDHDTRASLAPKQAVLNADSYAYAAMSVLRNELVTPRSFRRERAAVDDSAPDAILLHGDGLE
jgi:hypothetical protein